MHKGTVYALLERWIKNLSVNDMPEKTFVARNEHLQQLTIKQQTTECSNEEGQREMERAGEIKGTSEVTLIPLMPHPLG